MSRKTKKELFLNTFGIIIALIFLFPFYWMVITSLKSRGKIFETPPSFFPKEWSVEGYQSIFADNMVSLLTNSIIVASFATIIVLLLAIPSAYGLARYNIKGKKATILLFLVTQMLPPTVILTPLFLMFSKLGILNSYIGPVVTTATLGLPFSVLMLRPYFLSIPNELEDAAIIDGAGKLRTFVHIMAPLALPSIVVSGAISFFFAWGDLIFNITFNRDQDLWPLTAGIYNAIGQYGIQWDVLMAFATVTAVPVLVIFILLQKQLVSGLTSGSVK